MSNYVSEILKEIRTEIGNYLNNFEYIIYSPENVSKILQETNQILNKYKEKYGDEWITDERGDSCQVKDLKIYETDFDSDNSFHISISAKY